MDGKVASWCAVVAFVAAVGCGGSGAADARDGGTGDGGGGPDGVLPDGGGGIDASVDGGVEVDAGIDAGVSTIASGAYQLQSQIDLTVEALLPEPAADLVGTMRAFSENPARTLFDLAQAAGVPALQEIRDALPDTLESRLEGWINDEIAGLRLGGHSVTEIAGSIASFAETAFTQFGLASELTIGAPTATHALRTIDLRPAGIARVYTLGTLPNEVTSATPACSTTGGALALGDHVYGIPYGEYAWRAVNDQILADWGTDVRGVLGQIIDCPTLAHEVATTCFQGQCVGHEAQLAAICERGLDEVVARVRAKVTAIRFDALHFISGAATLADDDLDGTADRLTSGAWDAEIDAGVGLRHVPATFIGTR